MSKEGLLLLQSSTQTAVTAPFGRCSVPPSRLNSCLPHTSRRSRAPRFRSPARGGVTQCRTQGDGPGTSRRALVLSLISSLASLSLSAVPSSLADEVRAQEAFDEPEEQRLELYANEAEGFALLRPASWVQVEKAGATALFEDRKAKANNIGVVVSPIRLGSLKDFGTPEFVADKLIQAERRKESTKDAQLVSTTERPGHGGTPVYEFEYTLDSSRGGMKRIFSAAFVNSRKLYLLNIAHSDSPEDPLKGETRTVLEQVLHSFDLVS